MDFLLTLEIGAYTYRLATRQLDVVRADGSTVRYDTGLSGADWSRVFRLASDAPANDTPVEIGPGVLDIPALIAEGIEIHTARAELARLRPASTLEAREVMVSGRVSELVYDDGADPVTFTILAGEWNDTRLVPSYSAVLANSNTPDNAVGAVVPIVFGRPTPKNVGGVGGIFIAGAGSIGHATETPTSGSGVAVCAEHVAADGVYLAYDVAVEDRRYVYHAILPGPDVATNVTGPHAYCALSTTLLSFDPAYPGTPDALNTRFVVAWAGYGVRRATSPEPVRTAGELIEFLLWRGGNVDRGRTAAAVGHLPIQVDGYIDDRCNPVDWITDNLSSILPVSIVSGPDGLYPVVARPYLDTTDTGPSLSVERREIYPVAPVVFESTESVVNSISIEYKIDASARSNGATYLHTGDRTEETGESVTHSRLAIASFQSFGERPRSIKTTVIDRAQSAHQVAAWMIRRYALPTRSTSYALDPSQDGALAAIEPGGPVTIVDPARGIDGLCVVEAISADLDGGHVIDVRTVNTI